eukprot:GHVQ01012923.1.p1 GENE.GHVQ01012923.1~~GHVQ01012923.1.p1  ORF type:complete len:158 (+),score=2.59 GHVQ01012923.1:117-590(+)
MCQVYTQVWLCDVCTHKTMFTMCTYTEAVVSCQYTATTDANMSLVDVVIAKSMCLVKGGPETNISLFLLAWYFTFFMCTVVTHLEINDIYAGMALSAVTFGLVFVSSWLAMKGARLYDAVWQWNRRAYILKNLIFFMATGIPALLKFQITNGETNRG